MKHNVNRDLLINLSCWFSLYSDIFVSKAMKLTDWKQTRKCLMLRFFGSELFSKASWLMMFSANNVFVSFLNLISYVLAEKLFQIVLLQWFVPTKFKKFLSRQKTQFWFYGTCPLNYHGWVTAEHVRDLSNSKIFKYDLFTFF